MGKSTATMTGHLYFPTPTIESFFLKEHFGRAVYLKMECFQPAASFKIRGLGKLCQHYVANGCKHIISSSAGNAGYAAAYAARRLGVKCTVVVPVSTREVFIKHIHSEKAKVITHGDNWYEANEYATTLAEKTQGKLVHPFDHPLIWEEHATIIDECLVQSPKPGAILVSVGGGGLACGLLQGMHRHGWQDVPLFTTETEGAASLAASIKAGHRVSLKSYPTVATSLATKSICSTMFNWTKKHAITPIVMNDASALRACHLFARDHRVLVEPACGVTLAPIYENHPALKNVSSVLVIVCGGIGVDLIHPQH